MVIQIKITEGINRIVSAILAETILLNDQIEYSIINL